MHRRKKGSTRVKGKLAKRADYWFYFKNVSSNAKRNLQELTPGQTIFQFQSECTLVKLLGLLWDPNRVVY